MKRINLLLVILVLFSFACQNETKPSMSELAKKDVSAKPKDGVFIHISKGYDNPHKVLMAVSLAVKMSEDKDVALFFDIDGVNLLTRTSENMEMENFLSLHDALNKLVEKKAVIMACPMCLKKAGIDPEQLREGVIVAEKDKFFNFTKGRILSLDY